MRFYLYVCACVIGSLASVTFAQDAAELSSLRADTDSRRQQVQADQADLEKYQEKITTILQDLEVANQALSQAAENELAEKNSYAAEPSPAAKRALDRAESAKVLAERKVASLESRLEFSQGKQQELDQRITSNRKQIAANQNREQQLQGQLASQQQARAEAAQAQKEREQQEAELQRQMLADLAEEKQRLAEQKQKDLAQIRADAEPKPDLDADQNQLGETQRAKDIVAAIDAYLAGGVRRSGEINHPILYSSIDGSSKLEHLGGEIYMVEEELSAGEHRMSVGTRYFITTIAAGDDGKIFRVYFDNRDALEKRLFVVNVSNLGS